MIATRNRKFKILAVVFAFIVLVVGYLFVYTKYINQTSFRVNKQLSSKFIKRVDSVVANHQNIVAIQIVNVDLNRNIRYIIYTSIKSPEVNKLYSGFLDNNIAIEAPVFIDSDVQNTRMIKLINHEFVCSSFKDTISYTFIPEVAKYISTVCAVSIPPSHGDFVGIVGIFLKNPPTDIEKDIIRTETKDLAEAAYPEIK